MLLLLLLLTNRPSERTSGESAGSSNIQEDGSAGVNSSFDADFLESVATVFLLLLLSASDSNLTSIVRIACLAGAFGCVAGGSMTVDGFKVLLTVLLLIIVSIC